MADLPPQRTPSPFNSSTKSESLGNLTRNRLERVLPEGLKVSQFAVLNHLVRLGGEWSPARLASSFQVTKGAMTNTLQRLETRGLIRIEDNPDDGRAKLVPITESGRSMRARYVESVTPLIADLSLEFSEKEFAKTLPVLRKPRQYLDAHRT